MELTGGTNIQASPLSFSLNPTVLNNLVFDKTKKDLFVQSLRDNPRHIGKACKRVGIERQTYYNHYNADKDFAKAVLEAMECDLDDAEENITVMARNKGGFLPAIALLRAHRGETWNPEHRMVVHHEVSSDEGARTVALLKDVVDAEVISPTETPPQIETKQIEQP